MDEEKILPPYQPINKEVAAPWWAGQWPWDNHLHGGGARGLVLKPTDKRSINSKDFSRCLYLHFTYAREEHQLSKVKIITLMLLLLLRFLGGEAGIANR